MVIPLAVRTGLTERLERHRREHFPELETLAVRCRGDLAYVTRQIGDGETEPMFRLAWKGRQDEWDLALWSEPERRYVNVPSPNGDAGGTPEAALSLAYETRPTPGRRSWPRATRWSPPAPDQPADHWMRPYTRAVRAHPFFVVLFVLAAVAGSVAILLLRSPTYTAKAALLVTPVDTSETGDLGLPLLQEHGEPTRTIQTAAAVVENREVAAAAAADLGGRWTTDDVLGAIDVTPRGQTNVLDVRATADDAETAAALASSYAGAVIRVRDDALRRSADDAIIAIRDDLADAENMPSSTVRTLEGRLADLELMRVTGDPTIAVAEAAEVPMSPDGSPWLLVVIAALVVGLVLAPGAALIIERLGPRRLTGEDEIAEVYPLAVLTRVPLLRRSATPAANERVRDAFRRLRAQIELARPRPRTIMITSPSDGDGRASTAVNLAVELAGDGSANVLLIDLDARLALTAGELGFVDEGALVAGFSRYRMPASRSLLLLSGLPTADDGTTAHVADAALEAIRLCGDVIDYVVLHAPPVDEMVDALRLAAGADALILVVRLGSTTRGSLEAARNQLASMRIPPSGYVIVGKSG